MAPPLIKLLTQPHQSWQDIAGQSSHPWLRHLLLLALIPAICLYIGTTLVGWRVGDGERIWLSGASALQLCVLLYLALVVGVWLVSLCIQWLSRSFEARPALNHSLGLATCLAIPFFLAGIAGLYPSRWLMVLVLIVAAVWSSWLLFSAAPSLMHPPEGKGMQYSLMIWIAAALVAAAVGVLLLSLWQGITADAVRESLGGGL